MCAGKKRTLRATIVTIFSHMTKDVSVSIKCETIFRLFFGNYHKFKLLSQGSAVTHRRYGGKYYIGFVRNLLVFPAVKEF